MRKLAIVTMLALATAGVLEAQGSDSSGTHRVPPTPGRSGFWVGLGIGPGSVGADCNSCSSNRTNGISGYIRLGGTVSNHVLLGGEVNGWGTGYQGARERMGFGSFVMLWYPGRASSLYLKFGVGGMTYRNTNGTNELVAKAPSMSLGIGYEFRVARMLSVTPYFNAIGSSPVVVRVNGQPSPTGEEIRANLVQLGVGLTWH